MRVPELGNGHGDGPIEVVPVVVLSQTFPARPSWIPEIRDFVRRCLAESPLTEEGNREVGETVFRALLDAAGPTGAIQVSFRIFPEHVEVDVLHSNQPPEELVSRNLAVAPRAAAGNAGPVSPPATAPPAAARAGRDTDGRPATFADWMSTTLRREGLTQEAAARQLGVSVKTVGRWVGGETEPRLRDLRRIQELFGDLPFP
jgi:Helix-turn-helix